MPKGHNKGIKAQTGTGNKAEPPKTENKQEDGGKPGRDNDGAKDTSGRGMRRK